MSLNLEHNGAGFLLSSARFQPTPAPVLNRYGLVTPPESPIYNVTEKAQMFPSGSLLRNCEGLCLSQSYNNSPNETHFPDQDMSHISETIYTIIEQVIEQKLADAMGPLRLNIRRFDSENTDLGCQVGRLEEQLQTLQSISVTAASNLEFISSLANQISEANNNLQSGQSHLVKAAAPTTQHQQCFNIPPQFCFQDRNSKFRRQNSKISKKSRILKNVFCKWRTGGAERD